MTAVFLIFVFGFCFFLPSGKTQGTTKQGHIAQKLYLGENQLITKGRAGGPGWSGHPELTLTLAQPGKGEARRPRLPWWCGKV